MEEHTSARAAQILREKGYRARALLGGYAAWANSGGETEPVAEPRPSPPPQDYPVYNPNAATQQNGSPQTVDDSKTPATVEPSKPKTSAPVKSTTTAMRKSKRHHRRMRATH
jgi:3-mercaptopyruvate sulfurtransferase SseA